MWPFAEKIYLDTTGQPGESLQKNLTSLLASYSVLIRQTILLQAGSFLIFLLFCLAIEFMIIYIQVRFVFPCNFPANLLLNFAFIFY